MIQAYFPYQRLLSFFSQDEWYKTCPKEEDTEKLNFFGKWDAEIVMQQGQTSPFVKQE